MGSGRRHTQRDFRDGWVNKMNQVIGSQHREEMFRRLRYTVENSTDVM